MKERPILMSAPMVGALLDGRKTQTRRIFKVPKWSDSDYMPPGLYPSLDGLQMVAESSRCLAPVRCPYGQPGDKLWVKETFNKCGCFVCSDHWPICATDHGVTYREGYRGHSGLAWTSPIYMPRWASRITLEVTLVRVHRLQEISEEDAIAEGLRVQLGNTSAGHMWDGPGYHDHVSFDRHGFRTYHVGMRDGICICHAGQKLRITPARCAYRLLWESINGPGSWDANPWVWAITFRKAN